MAITPLQMEFLSQSGYASVLCPGNRLCPLSPRDVPGRDTEEDSLTVGYATLTARLPLEGWDCLKACAITDTFCKTWEFLFVSLLVLTVVLQHDSDRIELNSDSW